MDRDQDWTYVTIKKRQTHKPEKTTTGERKPPPPKYSTKKGRKLEEDTETFSASRVPTNLKLAIQQARQAKKMTQTQLAQKMSVKASVINDYESGRAIPNGAFIAKLERVLGTKLPRP
eukprot:gnl/Chilomastix_cuspidata/578.p1 GENE.gnl/Chilomastix_cuspidata/578~~gnl/Chilomastix_cuspidata/578.p1  ORF type:complete len:118 (-),score=32.86 gnl/Chilomastix_cuspidata/578:71-424(-)